MNENDQEDLQKFDASVKVLDLAAYRNRLAFRVKPGQIEMDLGSSTCPPLRKDDHYWSPVFLFQTCMPLRDVRPDQLMNSAFIRRNGNLELELRSIKARDATRLPYGKFPRLFLMWLTNAVTRHPECLTDDGTFRLRSSFREMCGQVGADPSRGKRGSGRALLDQIIRLINCQFTLTRRETVRSPSGVMRIEEHTRVFRISSDMVLSWNADAQGPRQWLDSVDGHFKLSEEFAKELKERRVPILVEHLPALAKNKSGMRIDVYCWLLNRNYYMRPRHSAADVSSMTFLWSDLMGQFGGDCDQKEFVRSFRRELRAIKNEMWPDLVYNDAGEKHLRLGRSKHPTPFGIRATS